MEETFASPFEKKSFGCYLLFTANMQKWALLFGNLNPAGRFGKEALFYNKLHGYGITLKVTVSSAFSQSEVM